MGVSRGTESLTTTTSPTEYPSGSDHARLSQAAQSQEADRYGMRATTSSGSQINRVPTEPFAFAGNCL